MSSEWKTELTRLYTKTNKLLSKLVGLLNKIESYSHNIEAPLGLERYVTILKLFVFFTQI